MLLAVELPLEQDGVMRAVVTLLDDYLYLLHPQINPTTPITRVIDPPPEIADFIATKLLPTVIDTEHPLKRLITERIVGILESQVQLPVYRDKRKHFELLHAISGKGKRNDCFQYFAEMYRDEMPLPLRLAFVGLLRSILHSGPSKSVDKMSAETMRIREICRGLLKSHAPVLAKGEVTKIMPILLEHTETDLSDVELFAQTLLSPDVFTNEEFHNDDWPSLTPKTFVLYLQFCVSFLNKKVGEFSKNVNRASDGLDTRLDEQSIITIMRRLNQRALLAHQLLQNVASSHLPITVHRCVLTTGSAWLDKCTHLLPFLRDAREVDSELVDAFLDHVRSVHKVLQRIVDHVRRSQSELQKLLARVTPALSLWTYTLKSTFTSVHDEGRLRVGTFRERPSQEVD
jgi:hypothetical protein